MFFLYIRLNLYTNKMKAIIIFIILLPTFLFGQPVNHFSNLDSKWNVATTLPSPTQQFPIFVSTTTTVYGFKGDTLINNKQWLKLYISSDSTFQNNLSYCGLLRAENRSVYFINSNNKLDTLYDFSLTVGDSSLFNIWGGQPEWLHVISVDSIQLNGAEYKRLKFSEPSSNAFDQLNEIWIEGIGSIHGPLFPSSPRKFSEEISDSMFVICTFSNNQNIWLRQSYPNCYVNITMGTTPLKLMNLKIYPNPFINKIQIENPDLLKCKLSVVDILGQKVGQFHIDSNHQTLDLSELKEGVYFLNVETKYEKSSTKIIKEN